MLELGEQGPALHAACGRAAAEAGLDLVAGVQGNAEHLATGRLRGRRRFRLSLRTPTPGRAVGSSKTLPPGDVVLIKGSRGVHLERAIEVLENRTPSVEAH